MSIIARVKAALSMQSEVSKAAAENEKAEKQFLAEAEAAGLKDHVKKQLMTHARVEDELRQADAETAVLAKVDKIQDWIETTLVEMEKAQKLPEQRELWKGAQAQKDKEIVELLDALNFKQN